MEKDFMVVAEIGCGHFKDMSRAKELIKLAKICDCDCAKFQKRNPEESVKKELWDKPHANARFAWGKTYLEHRKNLEFTIEQHAELKKYCENIGIIYSTSVWDMTSAQEIVNLKPEFIKVPSACNMHWEMLDYLYDNYTGQIHISMGMLSGSEKQKVLLYCLSKNKIDKERTVLYHCVSVYPASFEQIHLLEIKDLVQYGFTIGFSNHSHGLSLEPASYVLGSRWFERHFIDDRTINYGDAAASLEPDGLRRICRDLKALQKAMTIKPDQLSPEELEQRNKLRYY